MFFKVSICMFFNAIKFRKNKRKIKENIFLLNGKNFFVTNKTKETKCKIVS